jgi:hypothetical protein
MSAFVNGVDFQSEPSGILISAEWKINLSQMIFHSAEIDSRDT